MADATAPAIRVPGYEPLEEIGRGGHAIVYRARQIAFDRIVALKVVARLDLDGHVVRRFERECKSAGSLSWHPHIVVVYDAGTTEDGMPYLAMEYLERGSFAERVASRGPLPWPEAVSVGVQLAGALEAAHREQMLHRDVKPENVLIGRYGEAKLGDFGIAVVGGTQTGTAAGVVTATVAHAAPEVLSGTKATTRSDVYGLGSTLFALLTGAPAFSSGADDSMVALIARLATAPVPDLRPRGVPDAVAGVIESAMAKDPGQRPPSAAAFGDALRAIQREAGHPVTDMRLPGEARAHEGGETVTVSTPPPPVLTPEPPALTPPPPVVTPDRYEEPLAALTEGRAALPRRSRRTLVAGAIVFALVAASAAVLALQGDSPRPAARQVTLLPADFVGTAPFTTSVAVEGVTLPERATGTTVAPGDDPVALQGVRGSRDGLYAGRRGESACDRDALVARLGGDPERANAWVGVLGADATELADYVAGLTPVVLPEDTRVTDHTFTRGDAVPHQAVLERGTALLVDDLGIPRVRCQSGSPLAPPRAVAADVEYTGERWDGFSVESTRVVVDAPQAVERFVLQDLSGGPAFARPVGTAGEADTNPG